MRLFATLFAFVFLFNPHMAFAQGAVKSVHGDWEYRCDTPAGVDGEQCVVMQFVTAADRDNVGLTVIVLKNFSGRLSMSKYFMPVFFNMTLNSSFFSSTVSG